MADKIAEKAPEKAKKEKKEKKNGFWKKVSHFFKDFRSEAKKIVWPSKKQIVNNTIVVFVAMGVIGAAIWIIDFVLSTLRQLSLGLPIPFLN